MKLGEIVRIKGYAGDFDNIWEVVGNYPVYDEVEIQNIVSKFRLIRNSNALQRLSPSPTKFIAGQTVRPFDWSWAIPYRSGQLIKSKYNQGLCGSLPEEVKSGSFTVRLAGYAVPRRGLSCIRGEDDHIEIKYPNDVYLISNEDPNYSLMIHSGFIRKVAEPREIKVETPLPPVIVTVTVPKGVNVEIKYS